MQRSDLCGLSPVRLRNRRVYRGARLRLAGHIRHDERRCLDTAWLVCHHVRLVLHPRACSRDLSGDSVADVSVSEVGPLRRKLNTTELLDLREHEWSPKLRGASLVAEVEVADAHTAQVSMVLGAYYGRLGGANSDRIFERWPACVVLSVTGVAARDYAQSTFWPAMWRAMRFDGDQHDRTMWGNGFSAALGRLGMPTFPFMPTPYVGPILMHTGIPTYCLDDFLRLLLVRSARDPALDAERFLAWTAERDAHVASLDVPVRRFLRHGSDFALDVVDRTLNLLEQLRNPEADLQAVGLPQRLLARARELAAGGLLDLSSPAAGSIPTAVRSESPRIGLDPFGRGVEVKLPAVSDMPDGVAVWRITADGMTVLQRSQAQWVGVSEAAPPTTYGIPRPVRNVVVALNGSALETGLSVVDPDAPMLIFTDDGRRHSDQLSLPRDAVWVLHPEENELTADRAVRVIAEGQLPLGWSGWLLSRVSLDGLQWIGLADMPATRRYVRGFIRPRIDAGEPVPGLTTPYGSPVFSSLPMVWLPGKADAVTPWRIEVATADGTVVAVHSHEITESTTASDLWESVSRPVLGAFVITVRSARSRCQSQRVHCRRSERPIYAGGALAQRQRPCPGACRGDDRRRRSCPSRLSRLRLQRDRQCR